MQSKSIISENYKQIVSHLPENVQLIAVTKTHSADLIQILYNAGHRAFGENKVQELLEKYGALPKDIKWHLIGHLQSNKVKHIVPFVHMIESVDSEKLLSEINRQAARFDRTMNVLLQVKIAKEDTKYGLGTDEARNIFNDFIDGKYPNIIVNGLMGMATFTDDSEQIKREFTMLRNLFDEFSARKILSTLSMGMSADYELAIECGTTSVRIGSGIFGTRHYDQ